MEAIELTTTKGQIEDFKESSLWHDIVTELTQWKQGFAEEMLTIVDDAADSNPSSAAVLLHMGDLNGRMKAVDYMLALPDIFVQLLEDKKDERGREEGRGPNSG